jgi:hypothetical protein
MQHRRQRLIIAAGIIVSSAITGCAGPQARAPVENLDQRTGMTIATLQAPVEFVESGMLSVNRHSSFAYLGPIEWDRMGEIRYGLWIHIAPGNDRAVADITSPAAVSLSLDDETVPLSTIEAPRLGLEPYPAAVPWGQTAYFALSVDELKRLASAEKLTLHFHGVDGQRVDFDSLRPSRPALSAYARSRGITVD